MSAILRWACDEDVDEEWSPLQFVSVFCASRWGSKLTPTTLAVSLVDKDRRGLLLPALRLTSRNAPTRIGFILDVVVCCKLRGLDRLPGEGLSVAFRTSGYAKVFEILYYSAYWYYSEMHNETPQLQRGELGPPARSRCFLQGNAAYEHILASKDALMSHFATPHEKYCVARMVEDVFMYGNRTFVVVNGLQSISNVLLA